MKITEVIEKIRNEETITPGDLASFKLRLAAEYSSQSQKLINILRLKASAWIEIRQREEITSDKMADRVWEGTESGKEEMSLKLYLKSLEKLLSSINARLRVYENEARHSF